MSIEIKLYKHPSLGKRNINKRIVSYRKKKTMLMIELVWEADVDDFYIHARYGPLVYLNLYSSGIVF